MLEICSNNNRQVVLDYWDRAFESAGTTLLESSAPSAVLACHLTLFSGRRLEIYTPPVEARIRALVEKSHSQEEQTGLLSKSRSLKLKRVIVLIDDIYDMYARLQNADGLYQRARAIEDYKQHAWKLATGLKPPPNFTSDEINSVVLDMDVKNLLRLVTWRRSEMIAAEGIAKAFDVPLTVMSVKHEFDSLLALCRWPDIKTAYISHKITEPRVDNMISEGRNDHERWGSFVFDVNRVSGALRRTFSSDGSVPHRDSIGVVGIQPTAIDELRFHRRPSNEHLEQYSAKLGDRWPIPHGAIYENPSPEAPNYSSMLSNGRELSARDRGVVGLLQASIYDEIAFRDHLLVSCNQALVVFRPTALGARVSGGVRQEINHWTQGLPRPAAIIHIVPEFMAFVDAILDTPRLFQRFQRNFRQQLESQFDGDELPEDAKDWIWDNCVLSSSSPSAIPGDATTDHLSRDVITRIDAHFEMSCQKAIVSSLSNQFGVVDKGSGMVAHFMAYDAAEALSHEFMMTVSQFLESDSDVLVEAAGEANAKLLSATQNHFDLPCSADLARLIIGGS